MSNMDSNDLTGEKEEQLEKAELSDCSLTYTRAERFATNFTTFQLFCTSSKRFCSAAGSSCYLPKTILKTKSCNQNVYKVTNNHMTVPGDMAIRT